MFSEQGLKQTLWQEIQDMPLQNLQELLAFVRYLQFKRESAAVADSARLDPAKDPILEMIGAGDAPPFADQIDDIVYGVN